LPVWDLTDLYPAPDSAELKNDLVAVEAAARAFAGRYLGKVSSLDGAAFGAAIAEYETLGEVLYRILSYGQLLHAGNVSDPEIGRFYQGLNEKGTDISTQTLFFTLEIYRLDDGRLAEMMAAPEAAHYAPWVRDVRLFKDHQLTDDLEKLMHEKDITGAQSWVRLFDETMAALRFPIDGKDLTITEAMTMLSDRDPAERKKAAKALGAVLRDNIRL
jgi:oligoendopeptidase F